MAWSTRNSLVLNAFIDPNVVISPQGVPLLTQFDSISVAVETLNADPSLCPGGECAVLSRRLGKWNILYIESAHRSVMQRFQPHFEGASAPAPSSARPCFERRQSNIAVIPAPPAVVFSSMRNIPAPHLDLSPAHARDIMMEQAESLVSDSHPHGPDQWAVEHTRMLREGVTLNELERKAEVLTFGSVRDAVAALTADGSLCPAGFGCLFSSRYQKFCVIYSKGRKEEALSVFQGFLELDNSPIVPWVDTNTRLLCGGVDPSEIVHRVTVLAQFDSVYAALHQLNLDDTLCPQGFCVIHSQNRQRFVLLFRAETKDDAFDVLQGFFDLGDRAHTTPEQRAVANGAPWAEYRSRVLIGGLEAAELARKTQHFDFESVSEAVAALNRAELCDANSCVVFSKNLSRFCLLYRKGMSREAVALFPHQIETNGQAMRFTDVPNCFQGGKPFERLDATPKDLRQVVGHLLPDDQREHHLWLCYDKSRKVPLEYSHVPDAHRQILCSYSAELEPQEKAPYVQCNKLMRDGVGLGLWRPYIDFLFTAWEALPPLVRVDTVFRGWKVAMNDLGDWQEGKTIHLRGFTSVAERLGVMKTFVGETGPRTIAIMKIRADTGKRIKAFSLIPEEEEILIRPDAKFIIQSTYEAGHGLSMVECEQIE